MNDLNKYEELYINQYNSFNTPHGLNLISGGDSKKHTKETIEKLLKRMKGNKIWLSKKHTTTTKQKISESNKGKTFTNETRKKMTDSAKNKKVSNKTRKKMSLNRIGKEKPQSEIDKMLKTK